MANPSDSSVQNLLPVQAYFDVDGNFQTFIGQGQPFYATPDPEQSGLHITDSTIDSTPIGATTPSTGAFTSGTVAAAPIGATDIANKQYVDYYAAGLSWKEPCLVASTANITTLSGLLTIDTITVAAGDRVLVKNQSTASQNGIYTASAGAWTRAVGADDWNEYLGAITFIIEGSQGGSAWYCTAQPGGTLGVTALNWSNFSVSSTYTAGTGLTLSGSQFSITNTGVTAGTYGNDARTVTLAINAQGQITSAVDQPISIAGSQITSGTIGSSYISGAYANITGVGTLGGLTVTNPIVGSITGSAASATTATTTTNIAGGAAGSVPYQSASGVTALLAAGTNGQVLTLASGVPSWATPTTGTVTSVSGAGTVNGLTLTGTVTSSGSLTLGGTLDLSSPPAIGGTAANTINGTTITASTAVKSPYFDATTSAGGALRNQGGTACLQWGAGGGTNVTIDGPINMNGANSAIQISPTGTGTVAISPAGALTVNPATASTMNNVAIGGTTPLAGTFTDLRVNGTISLAGSTGTSGYALISNGASAPTWQAISAGLTVTDDTSTNATRYLTFTSATSGSITGINTSSTELSWNPSTGVLNLGGSTGALTVPTGTTAERPSTPVVGMTRFNTTLSAYEVYVGTGAGWVSVAANSYSVNYLAVAGGAGGGATASSGVGVYASGGGGGGGGLLASTTTVNSNTVYTITIGAGGAGSANQIDNGTNGSDTTGLLQTAIGGGGGGSGFIAGLSGGSGGGGGYSSTSTPTPGGAGTTGQGFAGGSGLNAPNYGSGGGGGAGAAGYDGTTTAGGSGGIGAISSISGSSVYYAGGGGGGTYVAGTTGTGGAGGGGNGGTSGGGNGSAGSANTGGGGGGGSGNATTFNQTGGAGGSGIFVISYAGSQRGTGGTVTTSGGFTIHTFTSSSTYTA